MLIASTSPSRLDDRVDAQLRRRSPGRPGCPWAGSRRRTRGRVTGTGRRSARRAPAPPASRVTSAPGGLAHLGHRVDERDLGGQEGVRRDLDQLGRLQVHDQRGHTVGQRHRVDVAQPLGGATPTSRRTRSGPGTGCPGPRGLRAGIPGSRRGPPRRRPVPARLIRAVSRRAVPTGTVDFPTTRHLRVRCGASASTTAFTYRMSAEPSAACGVPTQRKCTSPNSATSAYEVVKRSRPASRFLRSNGSRPGSKNGASPPAAAGHLRPRPRRSPARHAPGRPCRQRG